MSLYDRLPDAAKIIIKENRKALSDLQNHIEGGSFKELFRDRDFTIIQFHLEAEGVSTLHRLKGITEQWMNCNEEILKVAVIKENYEYHEQKVTTNQSFTVESGKNGDWGNWFGAYTTKTPATVFCICHPPFIYENFEILTDKAIIENILRKNPKFEKEIYKLTSRELKDTTQ